MDKFNVIWCALWSDYVMILHQYDSENEIFEVPVELAHDFIFFLSEIIGVKKDAYYSDESKKKACVEIDESEIDALTDWIMDFNQRIRKPLGLIMPDLYLDEDCIRDTTVMSYCSHISDFILYMLNHQSVGREKIADWAASQFAVIYMKAYSASLLNKT